MPTERSPDLSLAEAAQILKSAFAPLQCGVDDLDYGRGLKAAVYDSNDKCVWRMSEMGPGTACYSDELRELIARARENVKAKGYTLAPWTFAAPKKPRQPG